MSGREQQNAPPATTQTVAKQAFTITEVAESLGLSEKTIDGLIADKKIGSVLIGKRARRITAKQLDDYLRALEREAGWVPTG